jgi:hypothetical protein
VESKTLLVSMLGIIVAEVSEMDVRCYGKRLDEAHWFVGGDLFLSCCDQLGLYRLLALTQHGLVASQSPISGTSAKAAHCCQWY